MLGLRAEYEVNDNFNIGATYLKLFERPFTQKINLGNDPISNRVFGLDMEYSNEAPWLTRMVDKLPFYSTKEASSINFALEGAVLKPGHSSAINLNDDSNTGVSHIDDFEGAVSGFLIGSFNTNIWSLSSTPAQLPESVETNSKLANVNRAMLNWYSIDQVQTDQTNAYTRLVQQEELFQREVNTGQGNLNTFDLSFYPNERGPYNYDVPEGTEYSNGVSVIGVDEPLQLENPESRWGGIMRSFRNTDFEATNYQFIEFFVLNPFMNRPDGIDPRTDETGFIEFHLGSISEDVLADNNQFFENALPIPGDNTPVKETAYGNVPLITPVIPGFDRENGFLQDLGFDGINDSIEGVRHDDYINALENSFGGSVPNEVLSDPAGDNFVAFNDGTLAQEDLLTKYRKSSNPQGNLPDNSNAGDAQDFVRGNRLPDVEDLNGNNSLDRGENYYVYRLPIKYDSGTGGIDTTSELAKKYIRQAVPVTPSVGNLPEETWYRVQIPLNDFDDQVGVINGFRSIQFMRIMMHSFQSAKTFRMAEFELVRNIWRTQASICRLPADGGVGPSNSVFTVDDVGIEENSRDTPFNYVTPPNVKQEELFNTFSALRQDEKSLELDFRELEVDCEISINKLANINLTFYDRLQLFTHLHEKDVSLEDGDVSLFVRLGDDSEANYYEYRIPLKVSRNTSGNNSANRDTIWPDQNFIDLPLKQFTDLKVERNKAGAAFTTIYPDPAVDPDAQLRIVGNPSLTFVREIEIGASNTSEPGPGKLVAGKIWINELRVAGFKEQAGYAATARMQLQMADLGELNFATTYTGEGWGGLDQKLEERNQFSQLDYDASTSLELSKLLPGGGLGLTIPFFAQYSKSIKSPQFEAYSEDLTFDEAVESGEDRADVEARSQETTTIKTFNFTNVKKARSKDKKTSYPWDISNVSASYGYTQTVNTDPISEYRNQNLRDLGRSKNYDHNITATYSLPFKLIPGMDWVSAKADYKAGYRWDGGALITIDEANTPLGNTISNNQTRSGNVTFSFDKLYSKVPYLKAIDKGKAGRKRSGRSRTRGKDRLGAAGAKTSKSGDDKDKKKENDGPSKIERILIRPLLALRDVKFSYKEDLSTFLPGFMPQSNLLGMSRGFAAPGWAFIGGLQPNITVGDSDNFLVNNIDNGYWNPSQNFSEEIIQSRRHNLDLKIGIEPFKDFDIDVTFRKDYQETHTEVFKNKNDITDPNQEIKFIQNAGYDIGQFEASYSGLSTLFKNNDDLYQNFIALREQVSQRLPNKEDADIFDPDFPQYAEGFGPDNGNVLIPAFLGAYTNKTIDEIDVNASIDETVKAYNYIPKPNWTLKYDGLSKLSMFKDVLSNFSLTHGYKSSIRVNSFNSQPEYDADNEIFDQELRANGNYYSRVEVPTISIDEQFAPVIGVSLKTKTDLQLDFEYRKSRRLDLGIAAGNLTEVLGTEYIMGFAYTIKDFQGFGKKKKSSRKKKGNEEDDKADPLTNDKSKRRGRGRGGNVNSTRGKNITMNFDFSYSDDVTWIYRFREELSAQPQRGQTRIFINPYVDYEMSENLNLRFFFEYSKTKPYSRTSFDRTNMEGGITVQFKLN